MYVDLFVALDEIVETTSVVFIVEFYELVKPH